MTTLYNPLLNGFHPDPSVVKVGDEWFLATSTFEYLPGIPIHRSRDFETWELIGHVSGDPEVFGIADVPTAGGVWAPTIRHRDGVFHLVITVAMGRGMLHFTATDAAGPWSQGDVIRTADGSESINGIDPDIAWDADGNVYITYSGLILSGAGTRHAPRHPAGEGRSREPPRARGAALGVVGHRRAVPRSPAPLRGRRHLVPDDRRGRHGARPRHQHRAVGLAGGPVRDGAAEPAGVGSLDDPPDPEHRARRPRHRSRRRVAVRPARRASPQHDPRLLRARPRDLRHARALAGERLADDRPGAAEPASRNPRRGRLRTRRGARRRVARHPPHARRRRRSRRRDPAGSPCTATAPRSTTRTRSSSGAVRSTSPTA